jgi:hypothetical protein
LSVQKRKQGAGSRARERSGSGLACAARARCKQSDDVQQAPHFYHVFFFHEGAELGVTPRHISGAAERIRTEILDRS